MFTEDPKSFVENCAKYLGFRLGGKDKSYDEIIEEGETDETFFVRFDPGKGYHKFMFEVRKGKRKKEHAYPLLYKELEKCIIIHGLKSIKYNNKSKENNNE